MTKLEPFLRWAGSKRKLLPKLVTYWSDEYRRYVEPFMGSACLFFALQPNNALLSDCNTELVETFLAVRAHPRAVYNRLTHIPRGKTSYYKLRGMNTLKMKTLDRAARFIFLNRYCFNGLYRTNQSGQFNVPFAPSGTGNIPTWEKYWSIVRALRGINVRSGDFEEIITSEVKEGAGI